MTETLTKAQKAAVEDRGGPLLVAAAAGSGKTKVLVDRLMGYLCQDRDPANVDEFLIITYTKAAASELRGKIGAKLTEVLAANPGNRHLQRQVQRLYLAKISTVHSFCGDLLREYAFALELPGDFRVADELVDVLIAAHEDDLVALHAHGLGDLVLGVDGDDAAVLKGNVQIGEIKIHRSLPSSLMMVSQPPRKARPSQGASGVRSYLYDVIIQV